VGTAAEEEKYCCWSIFQFPTRFRCRRQFDVLPEAAWQWNTQRCLFRRWGVRGISCPTFQLFASADEIFGLGKDGVTSASQFAEVTKISDTDKDGVADATRR
jgi:hypothetical protein